MSPPRSAAFTLLEIVISVALIIIIAAISLTGMKSFRSQSERVGCINHLREIYVALRCYAGDNEQRLPMHRTDAWVGWYSQLNPYLGNRKAPLSIAPRCPSFRPDFNATNGYSGYAYNANCNSRRITAINSLSTTPILWDDKQLGSNNYGGWPNPAHGTGGTYCDLDFRHVTHCNTLMLDGSVIALTLPAAPTYAAKPSPKDFPTYQWNP